MAKTRVKLKQVKLLFLGLSVLWVLFWVLLFLPFWLNYLTAHPDIPIYVAFLTHELPFFALFFAIAWVVTTKIENTLKFAIAEYLIFSAFVIAMPPLCLDLHGNLLVTATNQSCRAGTDSLVASFWSPIIPFGSPLLFYFTYIGGFIIFLAVGLWLIKKKDLIADLKKGIPL